MNNPILLHPASHNRRRRSISATNRDGSISEHYDSLLMAIIGVCGFLEVLPHGWLGVSMLLIVSRRLYRKIDHAITMLELAALIMVMQCVIGPLLMYQSDFDHHRYMMYVHSSTYFQYVIPAVAAFIMALFYPIKGMRDFRLDISKGKDLQNLGFYLLGIGILGSLGAFVPGMQFFFYLAAQFKYVGAICLFIGGYRFRWIILLLVLFSSYLNSAEQGMFGELFFWGCFIVTFILLHFRQSHALKISLITGGALVLLTLQGVKAEYREAIDEGRDTSLASLLNETFWSLGSVYENEDFRHVSLTRLNQGWIISKVMRRVPEEEPFANGSTIKDAVYSSIVPRFFDQNKTTAGGRESFLRYTGLYIMSHTTMCIGLLGEAYVNYDVNGGIILMFILGVFFNRIFALFIGLGKYNSYFLLCLPLIFLQAVKPETDFVTVVNHLTKASLIVFMVYLALPNLLGSLKNKRKTKSIVHAIHSKSQRRPLRAGTQTSP